MTTDARLRFLTDRVATASPAQRVVMLYDRAVLDLTRAAVTGAEGDRIETSNHLMHALDIVAELRGTLDVTAWSGAHTLATLYDWMAAEIIGVASRFDADRVQGIRTNLDMLRSAWSDVAAADAARPAQGMAAGWIG